MATTRTQHPQGQRRRTFSKDPHPLLGHLVRLDPHRAGPVPAPHHRAAQNSPPKGVRVPANPQHALRSSPPSSFLQKQNELAQLTLGTPTLPQIEINHVADWWLGDVHSPYFDALAQCIEDEWKIRPLLIREGGSIPSLPFLEREYSAASVHFPMGQASDSAHLPDEKIRVDNLEVRLHPFLYSLGVKADALEQQRGKNIISKWLCALPSLPHEVVPDSP